MDITEQKKSKVNVFSELKYFKKKTSFQQIDNIVFNTRFENQP